MSCCYRLLYSVLVVLLWTGSLNGGVIFGELSNELNENENAVCGVQPQHAELFSRLCPVATSPSLHAEHLRSHIKGYYWVQRRAIATKLHEF